jgi:diguanylate cyclase (GGDEF)-like protein/PAS domain S-box-containing protein
MDNMIEKGKNFKKGDVLVVDDNPQNLRLLLGILSDHGYKVRPAPSGPLALKSVSAIVPDLILLDINMPGMNGYEVCQHLKSDQLSCHVPVIFISALNDVEEKIRAFQAGGVDYITKPFQVEEVLARVETHLAIQDMRRKLESQNARLEEEIRERGKAEETARILAMFSDENPNPVLRVLSNGTIVYANRNASRLGEFLSHSAGEQVPEEWLPCLTQSLVSGECAYIEHPVGNRLYNFMIMPISDTEFFYIYGQDITVQKDYEKQLLLEASVFENTIEGILITASDGTIQKVNPGFTAITGYAAHEVVGQNPRILRSGRHDSKFYDGLWNGLLTKGQWQGEIWNRRKDGQAYPQWMTITAIKDSDGKTAHYVSVFRDITDEKSQEEKLKFQAYHDPLTGLPNRQLFNDRLDRALAYARHSNRKVAVFFLDLDKFKAVNDTLGHKVGDLLLQEAAVRFKTCVRNEDTVARLAGDEFTFILQDIAHGEADSEMVARRVITALSLPFSLEGHPVSITPSIGITIYPSDGSTVETLLKNADAAMYAAKKQGRGRYVLFRSLKF